jgi:hypothetical protein
MRIDNNAYWGSSHLRELSYFLQSYLKERFDIDLVEIRYSAELFKNY